MRYSRPFRDVIPHSKAGHPRVTHPFATLLTPCGAFAFDLHVLGTPPALILSQDQTLKLKWSPSPKAEQTLTLIACLNRLSNVVQFVKFMGGSQPSAGGELHPREPGCVKRSPPGLSSLGEPSNLSRGFLFLSTPRRSFSSFFADDATSFLMRS